MLDISVLLLGGVSHDVGHMAQNDELYEQGDKYPNWSVKFKSVLLIFDLLIKVRLVKVSPNKG